MRTYLILISCLLGISVNLLGQFENTRLGYVHSELVNGAWEKESTCQLSILATDAWFVKDDTAETLWIDQQTFEQRLIIHIQEDSFAVALDRNERTAIDIQWTGKDTSILGFACQQLKVSWGDLNMEAWIYKGCNQSYIPYISGAGVALSYTLTYGFDANKYELDYVDSLGEKFEPPAPITAYQKMELQQLEKFLARKFRPISEGEISVGDAVDMNGTEIMVGGKKEQLTLINFWYTQCPPCIKEIPSLNALKKKYQDQPIDFLAITFDDVESIQLFLRQHPFNFRIIPNASELVNEFQIRVYPTSMLIDKNGGIIQSFMGGDKKTLEEIDGLIQQNLH